MQLAAGQPPQQIRVDRTEGEFAACGARAGVRHMIEQPSELGAGEIRIEHEPGLGRDHRFVADLAQPRADIRSAPVLPDNGAMQRLAGGAVPDERGFTLIGDADGGDVICRRARLAHRVAARRNSGRPQILRIVLDLAVGRKILREFLLGGGGDRHVGAKQNGAGRRRALVDCEHEGCHLLLPQAATDLPKCGS